MGSDVLKKFGRYFLLDRIAQGGMAEIYRARMASVDATGRILVIKRIQPGYGNNSEFLQMFKSEIRVTMGFSHPNIVQLYDFGEEEDQPYIAMEYVDGKNIRHLLSNLAKKGGRIPIDLSTYVIRNAAAGLHYAHSFKDKLTGEPLHIVHRDVSPQNILISFDGSIKIIDFGIAKASINTEATRAGIIKGKPSYLSPEQISGDKLDGRSDVFALGVVFWEMLTGKKLFASKPGENEFAVLKQIESCNSVVKKPSTLNPEIPAELDEVVMKALTKEREPRYDSAEEFEKAISKFLFAYSPDVGSSEIAFYIKDLFKDDIVSDRKKLQELNKKAENLIGDELPGFDEIIRTSNHADAFQIKTESKPPLDPGSQKIEFHTKNKSYEDATQKGSYQGEILSNSTPVSEMSGSVARSYRPLPPPRQRTLIRKHTRVHFPWKNFSQLIGLGMFIALSSFVLMQLRSTGLCPAHYPFGKAQQWVCQTLSGNLSKNTNDPLRDVASTQMIEVELDLPAWASDAYVWVNGQKLDPGNPTIQIEKDRSLSLIIKKEGFKSYIRETLLSKEDFIEPKRARIKIPLEPIRYGLLSVTTFPSAQAKILPIDIPSEKPIVLATPFENEKLPVGTYRVEVVNEAMGYRDSFPVRIEEGRKLKKRVTLKVN